MPAAIKNHLHHPRPIWFKNPTPLTRRLYSTNQFRNKRKQFPISTQLAEHHISPNRPRPDDVAISPSPIPAGISGGNVKNRFAHRTFTQLVVVVTRSIAKGRCMKGDDFSLLLGVFVVVAGRVASVFWMSPQIQRSAALPDQRQRRVSKEINSRRSGRISTKR